MSSTAEKIKERLSIQDVVSSYIKLERAGKNLKAKCPFHNEKTPSFFVSPERNSYYCFGCGAKGDIFTFVQEFEGLDFMGSLRILADRAGVEIEYANPQVKNEKDRLFRAVEEATSSFEENLSKNRAAVKYLKARGFNSEMLESFRVGFALDDWQNLHKHLTNKGFTDDELLRVGLIKKGDKGNLYDTFRSRIVFTIFDSSGRPIAFSGRAFATTKKATEEAKYLNSPDTPLFHKSEVLYGYDRAKSAMRKYDFCILVEGATDVLMSHQAGFGNTVAPLGTSLTESHLRKIKRLTGNILLALDADSAGVASASRGTSLALSLGFDVKIARLPEESDPADVIKDDPEKWRKSIREAQHIVDFLINILGEKKLSERKLKLEMQRVVLPYIAMIDNRIDQAHFVKGMAQKLDISESAVYEELEKVLRSKSDFVERGSESEVKSMPGRRDAIKNKMIGVILWQRGMKNPRLNAETLERRFLSIVGGKNMKSEMAGSGEDEYIFEAETLFAGSNRIDQYVEEMLLSLEEDYLRERFAALMMELKEAERDNNANEAVNVLKECQEVSQKIEAVRNTLQKAISI